MSEQELIDAIRAAEAELTRLRARLFLAQNQRADANAGLTDEQLDAAARAKLAEAKAAPRGERDARRAEYSELAHSARVRVARRLADA